MTDINELRRVLMVTIATSQSQQEIDQARVALDKINSTPTPTPEIRGNVTLPAGPMRTRKFDGHQYREYSSVVVSESYAKELYREYGVLTDGRASSEAAGERLHAALDLKDESGIPALLLKWPTSEEFFLDVITSRKKMYSDLDAEAAKIRAEREAKEAPVVIEERQPEPAEHEHMPKPDSRVVYDPYQAALNHKKALFDALGRGQ